MRKEKKQETTTDVQTTPTKEGKSIAPVFGYTPFVMMRSFTDDMDKLFEDFRGFKSPFFERDFMLSPLFEREITFPKLTEIEKTAWYPQIEVFEKDNKFTVRADLPGMKKEDIKIEFTDKTLTISGERKEETEEKHEGFYRTERTYGTFYRMIPLPEGAKPEKANAVFQNGVLEINMDVPEHKTNGRRIEIKEPTKEPTAAKVATK